jgi:glycosyltransferase involved in cell wall biosynthesis
VKVALVHDWLVGMRGGEKCLDLICELLPEAEIFTLLHAKGSVSARIEARPIKTSFLQSLPLAFRAYPYFLPLLPWAIEQFDMREYDAVVSVSHCVAKGIVPRPLAWHGCYCLTPMRYIWDAYGDYFDGRGSRSLRAGGRVFAPLLRMWDVASSARVDDFAAISEHVRSRISRYYRREAKVIYPPVDDVFFAARLPAGPGGYFLSVGAAAPNKRLDLTVEAFRQLGLPLVVAGAGPGAEQLRRSAPANVAFFGWSTDEELIALYQGARALVFPGYDDFGLTPLEAAAVGRPTIAFAGGGALETVVPCSSVETGTGVLFADQTAAGLVVGVREFLAIEEQFDPARLRAHARRFARSECRAALEKFLRQGVPAGAFAAC